MADANESRAIDYRGIPAARLPFVEDAEGRKWRWRRVTFRVGLVLVFLPVAFYFLPNWMVFGKLTFGYSPADFVQTVERDCVPTVRAMKEYKRDTGRWPQRLEDLVPRYLAAVPPRQIEPDGYPEFAQMEKVNELITYDLTPGKEGWSVSGPFVRGPIPVPAVRIGPAIPPAVTGR